MMNLIMARADGAARSLTTPPRRAPLAVKTLCGQFCSGPSCPNNLSLSGDQRQCTPFRRCREHASQPECARQLRQPLGIARIRLASRDMRDVTGIEHLRPNNRRLHCRARAFPANARTFHSHLFRTHRSLPLSRRAAVPLEHVELPLLDARPCVRLLNQRIGGDLLLMRTETSHTLAQACQFPTNFSRFTLKNAG
jgi:hypothetical protein